MNKVYIISRYKAETEEQLEFNRNVARHFCKQVINEGKKPVAPHLYYTQFLDEDNPQERELGLFLGITELHEAQEYLLVVIDGVISEGMEKELNTIAHIEIPGRIVRMTHREMKEAMELIK